VNPIKEETMKRIPHENTPRVIAVAIGLTLAGAALGAADGLFSKFAGDELALLGIFAIAFALLTYLMDYRVRSVIRGWLRLERRRAARRNSAHRLGGDLA
jgi:hypothetical protein